jgi:acyl-CoA thioesterase
MSRLGGLTVDALMDALALEPCGPTTYRAVNAPTGPGVIFGGQLLAQTVLAALAGRDGKSVKTVHTVFARAGSMDTGVEIDVEPLHDGRAFASSTVTIRQGERVCTRSLVLLTADEPDLIRHGTPMPSVGAPEAATPSAHARGVWQIRTVDGVDIDDPEAVGPPTLDVWTRFDGAPNDPAVAQALLAFATDGFLIGTAMRPHAGVGQAQAHASLSTGVVSHTLTFHELFDASDWLLLSHTSAYAGRGRSYGRADVFTTSGALVASFVQDSMIRRMSDGAAR